MKATFSISVVRKKEYKAMSNMPLLTTVPDLKHGYVVDTFDTTLRMSNYLVAVAVVYDFKSVSAGDNVTVWAPSKEIEAGTDILAQPYIYIYIYIHISSLAGGQRELRCQDREGDYEILH